MYFTRRTIPTLLSMVCIRLLESGTNSLEWTSFSTARTIPSFVRSPIAVLNIIISICVSILISQPTLSSLLLYLRIRPIHVRIRLIRLNALYIRLLGRYDHRGSKYSLRDRNQYRWMSWCISMNQGKNSEGKICSGTEGKWSRCAHIPNAQATPRFQDAPAWEYWSEPREACLSWTRTSSAQAATRGTASFKQIPILFTTTAWTLWIMTSGTSFSKTTLSSLCPKACQDHLAKETSHWSFR